VVNPGIELYADGAVVEDMVAARDRGLVTGFTTNPTLMSRAGVVDYRAWSRKALAAVPDLPISFEVLADDLRDMRRQALEIAGWGANVFVKVPITNTKGESTESLIRDLATKGVQVNATALLTVEQARLVAGALDPSVPALVSIFAGRIADTGRDPEPIMREALTALAPLPRAKLLWASCREVLNVFQARNCGCHVITVTPEILAKLALAGMDLEALSLDTVRMFARDAAAAGLSL